MTVAGVHQLLGTRLGEVIGVDDSEELATVTKSFKKAIRGRKEAEQETERGKLFALIPADASVANRNGAEEAIARFETVLAANTKAVSQVSRVRLLIKLVVATLAGLVAFLAAAFVLRVKEPFEMVSWTLDKALGKFGKKLGLVK